MHLNSELQKMSKKPHEPCRNCGGEVPRYEYETSSGWRKRHGCSHLCSQAIRLKTRALRGGLSAMSIAASEGKTCPVCSKSLAPRYDETVSGFRQRVTCGRSCAGVYRAPDIKVANCSRCKAPLVRRDCERASVFNSRKTCGLLSDRLCAKMRRTETPAPRINPLAALDALVRAQHAEHGSPPRWGRRA